MPEIVQGLGALAGLTAIVGLVALSALYASQARDVARLRRWAGRAPERATGPRPATPRRSISRPAASRAAVALVGLLAAYGGIQLTGDDPGAPTKPKRKRTAVDPGNVTVAVLNGTTVPGLAARLRDEIGAAGFRKGTIDVFSDQQLAESVVHYAPGHQAAAKAVGRRVGIGQRAPVNADSRALAGDATVIVIAGADISSPYR